MTTIETVQVTENLRLLVHYDESPECPRGDWHMLTGFVKIEGYGDSQLNDVPPVHSAPVPMLEAFTRFEDCERAVVLPGEDFPRYRYPLAGMELKLVERWARIFHGMHVEYDSEHGGFWFVAGADALTAQTPADSYSRALFFDNWPELEQGSAAALAKQAEVIKEERETYRQWADGEVYGVTAERRERYVRVVDSDSDYIADEIDSVLDVWEEIDDGSLWGIYADKDESSNLDLLALRTASEHFDLTDAEKTAVDAAIAEHPVTKREVTA